MIFRDAGLPGAFLIEAQPQCDDRGSFVRCFDRDEFAGRGLASRFDQESISTNHRAGTLRGLHYARAPHAETKLVRCIRGTIFDVVADLRPGATYGQTLCVILSADRLQTLYIPPGCAHGYQTLLDDTALLYCISANYVAQAADGVRFDDPTLGIRWPLKIGAISERDRALPHLS